MADNYTSAAGTGGTTFAGDDISSVMYPRGKIVIGADGVNGGDVCPANPMPVGGNTAKDGSGTDYIILLDADAHVQTDVVGSLPAGTAAIGKLAPNSGVDIGDVDVTSVVPGTGATSLGKAEDGAHASGDTGVMTLAVQTATPANRAGTDGDYEPLQMSAGRLWTSGVITGDALTALQLIDDCIYADDADWVDSTSKHVLIGGLYQSTPQTITDGDVGPIQVDSSGRQLVKTLNYDVLSSGTITAAEGTVTIAAANLGTAGLGISGTWAGTIVAEGNVGDGVWATIPLIHSLTGAAVASTAANGNWFIGVAGFVNVRIRASAWTSGTATVYLEGTAAPAGVFLNHSIPTGGNLIGSVLLSAGTALVGKVGIDQTTPGTTNAVAPISGQAGVAGGTGAMGATVQRVTLATDDPAVVDLAAMEALLITMDADTSKIPALGTAAMVAASPVTIATDDTMFTALDAAVDTIAGDTTSLDTKITACNTGAVVISSGAVTETNSAGIQSAVELVDDIVAVLGTATYAEATTKGAVIGAVRNDALATLANTDNEIAPVQVNAEGALYVAVAASATGGCSFFKSIDLDESEEEVKATAATLYGGVVVNVATAVRYLKIYNATAANVTVGTTVPDLTIPIPTQAGAAHGAGFVLPIPAQGVAFGTALTVAVTTGVADNDSGAPGANEVVVALFYK